MRKTGYYWCEYFGDWDIYYWYLEENVFILGDMTFQEREFSNIDEHQITRKEQTFTKLESIELNNLKNPQ